MNFKHITFIALSVLLISPLIQAQDIVTKKDGSDIFGKAAVRYQDNNDYVVINGTRIDSKDIDYIEFTDGSFLYSKSVTYYHSNKATDISKSALLNPLLEGGITLYNYKGPQFNFVLEDNSNLTPLQNIDALANTSVSGYKTVYLQFFTECIDREELFQAELNKNSLIYLVNTFNRCKNPSYEPLITPKEKTKIYIVNLGAGVQNSTSSITAPVLNFRQDGSMIYLGSIEQKDVPANGIVFDLGVHRNLFNTDVVFVSVGFSSRKYNIEIEPTANSGEIDDLNVNELLLNLGLNIKPLGLGRIYPEIETGVFHGFQGHSDVRADNSQYAVFAVERSKKVTSGAYILAGFAVQLTSSMSLFGTARYIFRDSEDFFTYNKEYFYNYEAHDTLQDNITLSFGIRIETKRVGFF